MARAEVQGHKGGVKRGHCLLGRLFLSSEGAEEVVESWVLSRDPEEEEGRGREGAGAGKETREEVGEEWRAGGEGRGMPGRLKTCVHDLGQDSAPLAQISWDTDTRVWKESHVCSS